MLSPRRWNVLCVIACAVAAAHGRESIGPDGLPCYDLIECRVGASNPMNRTVDSPVFQKQVTGAFNQTAPPTSTRPLKFAFYYRYDADVSVAEITEVSTMLLPTAASVLGRSIRVRNARTFLGLPGVLDEAGDPIPGDPTTGIEADLVVKVTVLGASNPECDGVAGLAAGILSSSLTSRPVYGILILCSNTNTTFTSRLHTVVHELTHVLGFSPLRFPSFAGAAQSPIVQSLVGGRIAVVSPNVLAHVRSHFACDTAFGAELEDDGGQGSANGHWNSRTFEGEYMDSVAPFTNSLFHRHVITDLTLGLLQDSGWYDVKYGAQGFNPYGYKSGCAFFNSTFEQALQEPQASRYLCDDPEMLTCVFDQTGPGLCVGFATWDGWNRTVSTDVATDRFPECVALQPGARCLALGASNVTCAAMACSPLGQVLINGAPCSAGSVTCPDDEYMCSDPGLLTCVGALNDCSGNGDCFKGACYCHLGWGGADCSLRACLPQAGCGDGSPCPGSGFCGVPSCGEWSSGQLDRGVSCSGALGVPTSALTDAPITMIADLEASSAA